MSGHWFHPVTAVENRLNLKTGKQVGLRLSTTNCNQPRTSRRDIGIERTNLLVHISTDRTHLSCCESEYLPLGF